MKNCPPSNEESVTVFSKSMICKDYKFIFGKNNDFTAFPLIRLPCPLIGYDIVEKLSEQGNLCNAYEVEPNKCTCNNACFKTESWEECGKIFYNKYFEFQ